MALLDSGPYDFGALSPAECKTRFQDFLMRWHNKEIEEILEELDNTMYYGLAINVSLLLDFDQVLCTLLTGHAQHFLLIFDEALIAAQRDLMEGHPQQSLMSVKLLVHIRLWSVPRCPESYKESVSSIRSSDIGRLVVVSGTLIRTAMVKMLEAVKTFECVKCHHTFVIHSDPELRNSFPLPQECPSDRPGKPCPSTRFRPVDTPPHCHDFQEIKIQDQVQRLKVGSMPRSIVILLEDDLVDTCKAGDDVLVTGVVLKRWKSLAKDTRCDLEMLIKANHIELKNEQKSAIHVTEELQKEFVQFWEEHRDHPLRGRDAIVRSFCPQLCGLSMVKLATLMTLIGGVQHVSDSAMKIRGESHLLLVGDPGTGKSQIMKFAAKLTPRSVVTTGVGSTGAGLTVMATKDSGGEWMLEAGALVLADGGLCCIDEFDSIREHDRATIHEAMEQQTLSVAKAGLVCKLNTRTTILAACNPKGKYDPSCTLSVNVALASPLLSRFDLVLILMDSQDEEWDREVSSFVLREAEERQGTVPDSGEDGLWSLDKLQAYMCYVKSVFAPSLSPEAETVLMRYYQLQRQADQRNAARTTVRLLESLMRLTEAHARLMFREKAILQDAVIAVSTMEFSMAAAAVIGMPPLLHASFPDDADRGYEDLQRRLLRRLGLSDGNGSDGPLLSQAALSEPVPRSVSRSFHHLRGLAPAHPHEPTPPSAHPHPLSQSVVAQQVAPTTLPSVDDVDDALRELDDFEDFDKPSTPHHKRGRFVDLK